MTISNNPTIIQGLVSLEVNEEHVYIDLIESAPFNIGSNKDYLGVPGNLIAFACKLSFQRGGEGYVAFLSKTKLIEHYEKSLGAIHIDGQNMVITTSSDCNLLLYFMAQFSVYSRYTKFYVSTLKSRKYIFLRGNQSLLSLSMQNKKLNTISGCSCLMINSPKRAWKI